MVDSIYNTRNNTRNVTAGKFVGNDGRSALNAGTYFFLENIAPPVVETPENGGFVLMKNYIPKVGLMKNY